MLADNAIIAFMKKNIVITGSTRGIGFAIADALLELGCAVTISGRTQEAVDKAIANLAEKHGKDRINVHPCDVTNLEQVQSLWDSATSRFKTVDIWVNNAGINNKPQALWEIPLETYQEILNTNVIGTVHGVRVVVKGMVEQGHGQIYNMEGYGSSPKRIQFGINAYGLSKAAITFFSKALVLETKDLPIQVGTIMPGMVMTDFILKNIDIDPENLDRIRLIFNVFGDLPENVGPFIARGILENKKSGATIRYLTMSKILGNFLAFRFKKRDIFADLF